VLRTLKNVASRLLPKAPSPNHLWHDFPIRPYDLLPPNPVILDIGSADSRGHYSFGAPPEAARVTCIDIEYAPGVDIVADAHDLSMIEAGSADCIVAVGMLLHCRYPDRVISEFHRVLRPGGIVYVGAPFVSPHPGMPPVYYFYSMEGLEVTCARFEKLDLGCTRGPASSMAHLLVIFNSVLFSFNNDTLFILNQYIFRWLFSWVKYFDLLTPRLTRKHRIYSGTYFIGRKRA
jgi:SAM-dependent methyltransferase